MRAALLCLLILCPILLPAQIRVDTENFAAPEEEVLALLKSVLEAFPETDLPPLFVTNSKKGPIALFDRSARGEVIIHLNVRASYWSQFVYQFAHELMHVRARFRDDARENNWLEETFCEIASLHALATLSESWQEKPPLPHFAKYRLHLAEYAQKIIASRQKIPLDQLPSFYQENKRTLRENPASRSLNGAMAAALLPLFQGDPDRFLALTSLNQTPAQKNLSLKEFFSKWLHDSSPADRKFILSLADCFLKDALK